MAPVAPRATGSIESYTWKDGRTVTWRLRIRAYGGRFRLDLGTNHEGWNEERARVRLEEIMGEVERGTWTPPATETKEASPAASQTIHETLSRWWTKKKREVGEGTRKDYERRLQRLLSFRPHTPTVEIDKQWVDDLRDDLASRPAGNRAEGSEKTLSPRTVNMTLQILSQALDLADDHDLIESNPARGKRRRMTEKKSRRPWLEPDMVVDLLDVAQTWEEDLAKENRSFQCWGRHSLLALLCLGGPRIEEALTGCRGDFDLAGDHWRIPDSKTEAGERTVDLVVTLAESLRGHVADAPSRGRPIKARGPMFPTSNGTTLEQGNVRRMLREVVRRTDERREAEGKMLLPSGVTPHSLRVTFVSLCFLAGRDPAWVMGQVGHKDAHLTLEVYTRTMQRKRVDRQLVWSLMRFADEADEWPGIGPANGPTSSRVSSGRSGNLPAR